jgi:hypothetical protein
MDRRLPYALIGALLAMVLGATSGSGGLFVVLVPLFAWIGWLAGRPARRTDARRPAASVPPRPDEVEAVLAEARDRGVIDALTHARLLELVAAWRQGGAAVAAPSSAPARVPSPAPAFPGPMPPSVSGAVPPPAPAGLPPVPAGPSSFERRLGALRDLIASDLAVHGLTYLGVLFLFVGAFGFVLFSFGSVRVALRPIAEVAAPAVLLGSARFLRRRGAPFVATALGLLGGVLLPIFLFVSLVDGVAVPPDLQGTALVVGLVAISLAAAAGYGLYARRAPDASVRFLVVPSLWLAVWAAALFTAQQPDGGYSLRQWSATQLSIVAVAVAFTAVAIRLRPAAPFAAATRRAVLPGTAVAYLLAVVLSGSEGWPAAPLVVAGLAALVVSEAVALPRVAAGVLQPVLLGATVVPLGPAFGVEVAGAVGVVAFLALSEWIAWRRPSVEGAVTSWIGAGISLVAAAAAPWPCVVAFGAASLWAHGRRIRPPAVPLAAEALAWAAAALPVGAGIGLVWAIEDGAAIAILGIAIAAASAAARVWRSRDVFLGWWVAAAAAAVAMASASPDLSIGRGAAATAAGAASLALFVATAPAWARGWAGLASLAWAAWSASFPAGIGGDARPFVLGALGCLAALAGGGGRRTTTVAAHAGGAGLALAAVALGFPARGWIQAGLLAAWVLAAAATTVWGELADAGPAGLLAGTLERVRLARLAAVVKAVPVAGAGAGLALLAVVVGEASGLTAGRRSWNGVVVAAVGVLGAILARSLVHRAWRTPSGVLVAPTAAVAAFFATTVGISVAAPDPWPTIEALLAPVAATLLLGGELRRPAMTWIAWIASAALAVLLSERAGVLPRDLWIATFGWGAALLVGGLAVDDLRAGRRRPGETIRATWLQPPVALAALAIPASLAFAFRGSPGWYAGWSLVAAALYLAVAAHLRAGAIASVPAALATVAYAVHLPGASPMNRPWLFVPYVAGLAAIAIAIDARGRTDDPWLRWDLGLIVAAHGVAVTALSLAIRADRVAPTWAAFGTLAIAYAVARRRVEWAAAGAVLLVVAAADAGPGWLALALAATAMTCAVAASAAVSPTRWILQGLAAVSAGGSWIEFLVWTGWSTPSAVVVTSALGAAFLIPPALVYKVGRLATDWTVTLWSLGLVASFGAALAAAGAAGRSPTPLMTDRDAGLVLAATLAATAVAAGASASRLRAPWQRETSAVLAVLAAARLGTAIGTSVVLGAAVAATSGLLAVIAWITLWRSRPASPWLGSIGIVAIAADLAALVLSAQALPRRDVLEAALVLAGVECAVAGVALRRPHLVTPSPVFVCAAGLVFAADAFAGEVQWFTVPSGLAILAVVGIERRARRLLGRPLVPTELLVAEYVGMALVVAAALIETISIGPVRGLVAVAAGVLLAGWGALTHVRRRLWFGAATVVVAAILMLAGPIAKLVPEVRGPALWGLLAAAGLVLIVAATMLERGRERLTVFVRRLDDLMEGWE